MKIRTHFRTNTPIVVLGLFLAIVAMWMGASALLEQRIDQSMRAQLLAETRLSAEAINKEHLQTLTGTAADLKQPIYLRLKEQLQATRVLHERSRFVYLMGQHSDGSIYFVADSEPIGSADESPAGQVYQEVSPAYLEVFQRQEAQVVGPITDRWGTWMTALVPITDPHNDTIIAVHAMDIAADDWQHTVVSQSYVPLGIGAAVLCVIVIFGSFLLHKRNQSPQGQHVQHLRHLETILTASVGVTFTIIAIWLANGETKRDHQKTFRTIAESQTAGLQTLFSDLRDKELEGLARFIEARDELSAEAFSSYASYLTRDRAVQAWEWIPAVNELHMVAMQQAMAKKQPGFMIWQFGPNKTREPARGRETVYPVLYVTPQDGNQAAIGFDLGSEPVRRAALQEALQTRLTTATDAVTLVQETDKQNGMLVVRPIFTNNTIRGFALAVFRLGTALAISTKHPYAEGHLYVVRQGARSAALASTASDNAHAYPHIAVQRPIHAFGKTFIAAVQPNQSFFDLPQT